MRNLIDRVNNFFDDWFDIPFNSTYNNMRTDIIEDEGGYQLAIDLPGVAKENIKISYKNGYLTVAVETLNNDNQEYIHRERYRGRLSRDYYVGRINEDQISANYENGVLTIHIPKESIQDNKKYISIN